MSAVEYYYTGTTPFDGLSLLQFRAIEGACKLAPASWHDGIWRGVAALLPAQQFWADDDINTAVGYSPFYGGFLHPTSLHEVG
jgi:hypothetical protein